MKEEFKGIEKRLSELYVRLDRIESFRTKPRSEFDGDPLLQDIIERNLEIIAQCCIDLCHRLIAIEGARKPADYYEAFLILGELNILPIDFAQKMAPLAGFRNILVHEYLGIDWDQVYANLQNLDEIRVFANHIRKWFQKSNI